jgi:WD40 repeat protein
MTTYTSGQYDQISGTTEVLADQILLTHCLKEDSALGRGGFSVRAASTSDSTLLNWAIRQLESYELPVDMQSGSVEIRKTPRRLALLPAPGNRTALIHSAYLRGDSCEPPRPHSYITHALIFPRLETATAVQAWDSPVWRTQEIERSFPKRLEPVRGVPRGSVVHDQAVTCFASGGDMDSARRCLRAAIHGFLRTFETGSTRSRLCILADPETVALLVYAISRLLPRALTEAFWFSTYEPPHTSLRENKVLRVLGSYTTRPLSRGEAESLRRDGWLTDMLQTPPECSPALAIHLADWPLEELLDLVAAGDWPAIGELHNIWTAQSPPPTLVGISQALSFRATISSMRNGSMGLADLEAIWKSAAGRKLLLDPQWRSYAWSLVRPAWDQPDIQRMFSDLIAEHADELITELLNRAKDKPPRQWLGSWHFLQRRLTEERRKAVVTDLIETVRSSRFADQLRPGERAGLLRAHSETHPDIPAFPPRFHWLLLTPDEVSFQALIKSAELDSRLVRLAIDLVKSGSAPWRLRELVGGAPNPSALGSPSSESTINSADESARIAEGLRRDPSYIAAETEPLALQAKARDRGRSDDVYRSRMVVSRQSRERILFFLLSMLLTLPGVVFFAITTGRLRPPPRQVPLSSSRSDVSPIADGSPAKGSGKNQEGAIRDRAALLEALERTEHQFAQAERTIAALREELAKRETRRREPSPAAGSTSSVINSGFADVPLDASESSAPRGPDVAADCRDFAFFRPGVSKPSDLVVLREPERTAHPSLAGELAIYAFEINEEHVTWTHQGNEASLNAIRSITSGHDQDVIAYMRDTVVGLVTPGGWKTQLMGHKVNELTLPKDPPLHRKFPISHPESECPGAALAVKGASCFAIARYPKPQGKQKDQAEGATAQAGETGLVECWDAAAGLPTATFDVTRSGGVASDRRNARVREMAFLPKSGLLVVCSEEADRLAVLDCSGLQPTRPPQFPALRHPNAIRWFDFSPDGEWLVSVDEGNALHCWRASRERFDARYKNVGFSGSETTCVAMSRDRPGLLATGDRAGKVTIWRFPLAGSEPGPPRKLRQLEHVGSVVKLEFSADGRVLAGMALIGRTGRLAFSASQAQPSGVIRIWPCAELSTP